MDAERPYEGKLLLSSDGEHIGVVEETYRDSSTGEPEWLLFDAGLLDERPLFVPVDGLEEEENGGLRVPYTAGVIREQPLAEPDTALGPEALSILGAYFGLGSDEENASSASI